MYAFSTPRLGDIVEIVSTVAVYGGQTGRVAEIMLGAGTVPTLLAVDVVNPDRAVRADFCAEELRIVDAERDYPTYYATVCDLDAVSA